MAEWESVSTEDYGNMRSDTYRMRVPGGWLYREQFYLTKDEPAVSVALELVPDPPPEEY